MKTYGVGGITDQVDPVLLEIAAEIAGRTLPQPAVTDTRYGVGFLVVHEARAFNTVIVDWWEQVNELRHHVFRADPERPRAFDEITASGESVCLWELRIQAFEREAWIHHVLLRSSGPDLAGYLSARLNETC